MDGQFESFETNLETGGILFDSESAGSSSERIGEYVSNSFESESDLYEDYSFGITPNSEFNSEVIITDAPLIIQSLDVLHNDMFMITVILLLIFAKGCLNTWRRLLVKEVK